MEEVVVECERFGHQRMIVQKQAQVALFLRGVLSWEVFGEAFVLELDLTLVGI